MVEGFGTTFEKNKIQNAIEVLQHVRRRNSHGSDFRLSKPLVASSVACWCVPEPMNCAVHFDAQARMLAIEVQHIRTGRVLSPELQPVGARAQVLPENDFRQRHPSA